MGAFFMSVILKTTSYIQKKSFLRDTGRSHRSSQMISTRNLHLDNTPVQNFRARFVTF